MREKVTVRTKTGDEVSEVHCVEALEHSALSSPATACCALPTRNKIPIAACY